MQKLTVLTAALAAGVMTFAFDAANAAPLSPRADQGLVAVSAKSGKAGHDAKATKRAPAKMEKASWSKAKKSAKRQTKRGRKTVDMTTTASIGLRNAAASAAAVASGGQYSAIVARYAASYGVPVSLAHAVIRIESNYRPNMVGSAGEIGLMQIKPATARMMGYNGSAKGLFDPDTNIKYGMKYLAMAQDLGGGTTCGTILKYNAGHAATRMNPVSAAYCSKVKVQMAAL
ncbi:lytic transglycosylase domain-containing protein [Mesorhizobium calcicola]|uniref:Lytic transglycosylase domain-containing protein n=1 Tax=Mesorhizobium calcicola TaxID=1300310 RepID=A0ABW4WI18_9HYPH